MSLLDEALKYADMGFAVFPVRQNKTPYTTHGCKDAKKDKIVISEWWKRWPSANIGIATGSISGGIVVIDIDIDENKGVYGDESLKEWEKKHGELPETWRAITGRGGYHYYYRTDTKIKNATGIYSGVDVRGEGGYVVAPPSVHANGNIYQWEVSPEDTDIHFADNQVMAFIKGEDAQEEVKEKFILPVKIETGKRNDTLFKYGCSMQSKGEPDTVILERMEEANLRCDEPLTAQEVKTIYESVISKPKGVKTYADGEDALPGWRPVQLKKTEEGKILQTIANIEEAIHYDRKLYGKIRYNTLAYAPYIFGSLPWDPENDRIREWTNMDDSNLKMYIEDKYGLKPTEKLIHALNVVAHQNKYNPVVDELEMRWHQWDGKEHIKDILPNYLGVEQSEYSTEVLKLFMLGAISRAYTPGCKFDYVPIIYGKQGCGKSTFCRYLAMSDEWYDDNFNTIDGDKAAEKLRGLWMAELAELLATKKAKELESIKSFITSRCDNYRPPYERLKESRLRVCLFIGTTNSEHFLTDRTGNRRFLPLIADRDKAKFPITDRQYHQQAIIDINNAWGEAMELYNSMNKEPDLVMPDRLRKEAEKMQRRFLEDDPYVGIIQDYLDKYEGERVCALEIWEKALKKTGSPQKYEINQIHMIMQLDIDGWVKCDKKRRCGDYGIQRCYEKDNKPSFLPEIKDSDLPFG